MTKNELITSIATKTGFTKKDIGIALQATFEAIADALKNGDDVTISNFGKFKVIEKEERVARNPMTGGTVTVPAHNVVKFSISSVLKNEVR